MNDMNLRPTRGGYSRQYSPNIDPTIHVSSTLFFWEGNHFLNIWWWVVQVLANS